MRIFFLSFLLAIAAVAVGGFFMQGCAKSGDAESTAANGEPEFTITGEAI